MKVHELLEAKVMAAQSKKVQKKLRELGYMEAPGHWHRRGQDWENTIVIKPNKKRK